MAGSMEERPNGPMDVQTHTRPAGMDGATAQGGRLLPYPIFNRSRILPWPAKGVEKVGNGAVLALPRQEGHSGAHILRARSSQFGGQRQWSRKCYGVPKTGTK